jgi:uncharacterized membrane protein
LKKKPTKTNSIQHRPPTVSTVNQSTQRTLHITEASAFAGPIPPPELLKKYNEIIPDGANRILEMAERQSAHRIELEKTVIEGDNRRANWGLVCGFTFGLIVFVLSFILIMYGHDWAGVALATTDLVVLVGTFVYGTRARRQERERRNEKNKALTRRGE